MEASGSLPIYCFVLFYRFNLLAHFDKCSPELWKSRLMKTKPKEKTTNPRIQDPWTKKNWSLRDIKVTLKREFETYQKRFWNFEIGPKFSETRLSVMSSVKIKSLSAVDISWCYCFDLF